MHSERKSAIQCSHRLCGIDTADTYAMPDLAGLLVSCIPYTCGTANLYILCIQPCMARACDLEDCNSI